MNFVKVALFALLLVALLVPVSTPSVSAGTDTPVRGASH